MPVKCPAIVRLPHPPQGPRGQPSIWIDKQICIPYTVYNRLYERPSMKIRVHRPLREEVYDAVRRAIVQGGLSPGNRVVGGAGGGGRVLSAPGGAGGLGGAPGGRAGSA